MIKEWSSDIKGKCGQCGEEDALFYDDDGNLLCYDCLFENEVSARIICPDCGAKMSSCGSCWYCEDMPPPPEKIDLIYEASLAFIVEMDRRFGPQYRAGEHVRDCFGQAIFDIGELVRAIDDGRWPVTWPHEELEVAYAA